MKMMGRGEGKTSEKEGFENLMNNFFYENPKLLNVYLRLIRELLTV